MKLCGCVVWYNPTDEDKNNIKTYLNYVDKLFIIDNSLKENYIEKIEKIEYICLYDNLGIAEALNIACRKAILEKYEWILTMDQDSRFNENFNSYKQECIKKIKDKSIALLSPSIILDKKTGYIEKTITSGNILNLKIWKEVGGFKSDFFIDEVDFEFCTKLVLKGYKIYKFKNIVLDHKIGNSFNIKIFGIKTYCMNHSHIRKYYIIRNRLFMRKMYPQMTKRYLLHIVLDFYKVIFYEKEKIKKIKYMCYGVNDYLKNKKGKLKW